MEQTPQKTEPSSTETSLQVSRQNLQTAPWIKSNKELAIYSTRYSKKIGAFENTNEYGDLVDFIMWWRLMLGVKEAPTTEETEMCLIHLKESYSDQSMEDLKLAVKYSLAAEFQVDAVAYNSFSPAYISRILNAYKSYKDKQLYKILKAKEAEERKETETAATDPHESRRQYLKWYAKNLKESSGYFIDFKEIGYEVLKRINPSLDPEIFYFEATDMADKIKRKSQIHNQVLQHINTSPAEIDVYKIAKYLLCKAYFEKITDVEACINSINNETLIPTI